MRERRVLWVVLAAFVVGMIAVAGLAAVDDSSSGPSRLPALALGGAGRDAAAPAATSMLAMGPVEYRVADGVVATPLPDHAPAWTVGDRVDVDAVRRLASALGVKGTPKEDDTAWTVHDDTHQVRVEKQAGAPWSFSPWSPDCGPDASVSSDGTVSCGSAIAGSGSSASGSAASGTATATVVVPPATAVEPCPMPDCPPGAACAQVCPTPSPEPLPAPPPSPERPADLPSKADAERIAREVLTKAGVDLVRGEVRVDDGFSQWMVAVDPVVGGLPTQGMASTVAVGPKGAIEFAHGWLGVPTEGDDYPLAGLQAGIERLKSGYPGGGWSAYPGGPEPAIARDLPACTDCPPQVRTITGVRLGLQFSPVFTENGMPADALLVPSYLFRFDDSEFEQPVIAVADEFLPKAPEVKPVPGEPAPMPVEPDGGTGAQPTGAACQGQGSTAVDGNAPLMIDACVDPNPAKVGQPVTFDVTYSDTDAPIPDNGCNAPTPDFERAGVAACGASCAAAPPGTPTTVAPAEPGKLAKTYTHTYEKPGTYKVTFSARSGNLCDQNPHSSTSQLTVEVTVRG